MLALIASGAPACASREGRLLPVARPPAALAGPLAGDFADPFVLRAGGAYYAFATGARGTHLQLATSPDLGAWTLKGDALPELPTWAAKKGGFTWAPSVLARGTEYVLYYTTKDAASDFQCISRAVAKRPEGPYADHSARALVCQVAGDARLCGSIDPSPFLDGDRTPYLIWKSDENSRVCRSTPRIWAQRLTDDGLGLVGAAAALLSRDRPWEGDIVEAPSMILHDGRYYLFYSANWYESSAYAIGYASCAGPLAACTKVSVAAPLLHSSGALLGPGGQELFTAADGALWMAYHAWTAPHTSYTAGGARSLRLARVEFSTDGAPRLIAVP
jgi:beta-xylosidase